MSTIMSHARSQLESLSHPWYRNAVMHPSISPRWPPRAQVLWKYHNADTGEPMMIWSPGRVARVADGLTDKRSPRARKILPAGALLWAWDADPEFGEQPGEQWLILLPDKWNRQVHYGWRFDPVQLSNDRAEGATGERVRGARRVRGSRLESEPLTDEDE